MNYAELTDDELRLEVARRCGWKPGWVDNHDHFIYGLPYNPTCPDYPRDPTAAIALLDGTGAEYAIEKQITEAYGEMKPLEKPMYHILIFNHNPVRGTDYNSEADTLPRAACLAWLMWMEAQE